MAEVFNFSEAIASKLCNIGNGFLPINKIELELNGPTSSEGLGGEFNQALTYRLF